MWESRTKQDLVIEVWEKLDCESVGAVEIEAIEAAVEGHFGKAAVDSPMTMARMLADEGAELRHSEIMELYLRRAEDRPYDAALRNVLKLDSLASALRSINDLENIRRKWASNGDKDGLRHAREFAIKARKDLRHRIDDTRTSAVDRQISIEINEWLSLWLQTPQLFADWVEMRQLSNDFVARFGTIKSEE
jgi:hypothetical protein